MSNNKGLKLVVTDPQKEEREVKQEDNEGKNWVGRTGGNWARVRGFRGLQVVGVDKRTV